MAYGPFTARMSELDSNPRPRVRVDEIHDPLPGRDMSRRVKPRAAESDAALRGDVRHFRHDERGPADRAAAEMDEMPVGGRSIACGVQTHRADDDAIVQLEAS